MNTNQFDHTQYTATVTFGLQCNMLQAFVQTPDMDFKFTINCPQNRVEIDMKYLAYNSNGEDHSQYLNKII